MRTERGDKREEGGRERGRENQREDSKIRKWRGFEIKHFLKLALLAKVIFPKARVGDPTTPHFQDLSLAAERETQRGREKGQRVRNRRPHERLESGFAHRANKCISESQVW